MGTTGTCQGPRAPRGPALGSTRIHLTEKSQVDALIPCYIFPNHTNDLTNCTFYVGEAFYDNNGLNILVSVEMGRKDG